MTRLSVLIVLTLWLCTAIEPSQASTGDPTTGNDWGEFSDSFKIGYVFGIVHSIAFFATDNPQTAAQSIAIANDIRSCVEKKHLTFDTMRVTIEGYIHNNPQHKNVHLIVLSMYALRQLCGL